MNRTFNGPIFAFFSLVSAGLLLPQTATAQGFVVGGGLARDCYHAVRDHYPNDVKALEICDFALTAESLKRRDRAATFANRGVIKMRMRRHDAALADYDRALTIAPEMVKAQINRGAALIYQKDYAKAVDALNVGVTTENQKDQAMAHFNRALAYEGLGDLTAAYFDFQTALELYPEFELAKRQLARFQVEEAPIN